MWESPLLCIVITLFTDFFSLIICDSLNSGCKTGCPVAERQVMASSPWLLKMIEKLCQEKGHDMWTWQCNPPTCCFSFFSSLFTFAFQVPDTQNESQGDLKMLYHLCLKHFLQRLVHTFLQYFIWSTFALKNSRFSLFYTSSLGDGLLIAV